MAPHSLSACFLSNNFPGTGRGCADSQMTDGGGTHGLLVLQGSGEPRAPEEQGGCGEESGGLRAPWAEVGLEEGSVGWAVQPWVTAMSTRAAVRVQATPGARGVGHVESQRGGPGPGAGGGLGAAGRGHEDLAPRQPVWLDSCPLSCWRPWGSLRSSACALVSPSIRGLCWPCPCVSCAWCPRLPRPGAGAEGWASPCLHLKVWIAGPPPSPLLW